MFEYLMGAELVKLGRSRRHEMVDKVGRFEVLTQRRLSHHLLAAINCLSFIIYQRHFVRSLSSTWKCQVVLSLQCLVRLNIFVRFQVCSSLPLLEDTISRQALWPFGFSISLSSLAQCSQSLR